MVTPEELAAGKTMLKAVQQGITVPLHIAQNVKNTTINMKFYWPTTEGGPNEFQGALLSTPEGEKFFLSPEVFLKAKQRYLNFTAGVNGSNGANGNHPPGK